MFRLVCAALMDIEENWWGGRRYMAQEGINELFNSECEDPSEKRFEFVDELLELEAQNLIYTT
jgi:hypothetical protein